MYFILFVELFVVNFFFEVVFDFWLGDSFVRMWIKVVVFWVFVVELIVVFDGVLYWVVLYECFLVIVFIYKLYIK